jgi:hypothetical protein
MKTINQHLKCFNGIIIIFLLILTVFSCAKEPVADIKEASNALDSAITMEANRYAPEQFKTAEATLESAMREIDNQKRALFFRRSYENAQKMLLSSIESANAARELVIINKPKIQEEAKKFLSDAKSIIEVAHNNCDPIVFVYALMYGYYSSDYTKKESVIEQKRMRLRSLSDTLTQASIAFDKEDYLTARDKASIVLQEAKTISDEVLKLKAEVIR